MTDRASVETVFDGELLRATLMRPLWPKGRRLYVTFRHRIANPGEFWQTRAVRSALAQGFSHLHVQSRWNDWFINKETVALGFALRGLRQGFDQALALGFSMGGFGALRFSADLDMEQVMLVSPQYTLDRDIVFEDRRYPEAKAFDAVLGDLARHGKPDVKGVVLFDRFRRLDHLHAALVCEVFENVAMASLGMGGHPATQALRQSGLFGNIQRLSLTPGATAAEVVDVHRRGRAMSKVYWTERATQCAKRGHLAAAKAATDRVEAMSKDTA